MANYYVDSSVPGPGTGAIGDPWDDINSNLSTLAADDTMWLRGGANKAAKQSYNEIVQITNANGCANGSSGNPITIQNYPGEYVVLDQAAGSDTVSIDRSYWVIDGTSVDGSGDYYFEIDKGAYNGQSAIATESGADYLELRYLEIHGSGYHQIDINDTDYPTIEYCKIYDTFAGAFTDAHGIIVRGFSDYGVIHDCEIYNCRGDCIGCHTDFGGEQKIGWEVYACELYVEAAESADCELGIGFKGGEAWIIHDNIFHGFRNCTGATGGSGADGQCIVIGGGGESNEIYDNEFYDHSGATIRIDQDDVIFHHNLIHDLVDEPAIGEQTILYVTAAADNIDLHNNTVVGSYEGVGNSYRSLAGSTVDLQNNIFKDCNTINDAGVTTYDYNCWFNCTDTLAGAHDVNADPLFTDEASNDFTLASGSPCIDAGIDLGYPFLGSAPDMGAFEFADPACEFRSATGVYTGDGNDNRWISDPGFEPDLVIIKPDSASRASFRTSAHTGDDTSYFSGAANSANVIQDFGVSGFQVGTSVLANSVGVDYYWVAVRDNCGEDMTVGRYTGDGNDNRSILDTDWQPTMVTVKGDIADIGVFRVDENSGDDCCRCIATNQANRIQQFLPTGFEVGTDQEVNANGTEYYWFAFKDVENFFDTGTYVGDGVDDRSITDPGFQPGVVFIKRDGAGAAVIAIDTMDFGDSARINNAAPTTNMVQMFEPEGFQIGTNAGVNDPDDDYYYWVLRRGTAPSIEAVSIFPPTFVQSRALSLLAFDPLWIGTNLKTDALGFTVDSLQVTQTAFGGYWTLRFNLTDRQPEIEDWIEDGLGRHIELYNPALELIWEGFVNRTRSNIGGLSIARGPHLNIANRIRVVYSTADTSVTPPAMGVRTSTTLANDPDSQANYGIIEKNISVGGVSATNAEQIRDTALDELKEPETSETDNLTSSRAANVAVECLGYFHWLKAYTYSSATTGTENANTKIENILTADPNSIFSTDYSDITTNTTAVGAYEQDNRTAMAIIKGIVGLGDSSFNRYLFGFHQDRKARYAALPTDTEYQRSLLEPEQKLARYATSQRVMPWDAQAGEWVFYTDLLVGRSQPSERRLDPRYLFIEQTSYSLPWALSLQGSRSGRLDQLLARLGLGGTSA